MFLDISLLHLGFFFLGGMVERSHIQLSPNTWKLPDYLKKYPHKRFLLLMFKITSAHSHISEHISHRISHTMQNIYPYYQAGQ